MQMIKLASMAIAAGMALSSGAGLALEAHEELEAVLEIGTEVEFEAQGVTMRVRMPCDNPEAGPPGPDGLQSSVCFVDGTMFIFASSLAVPPGHPSGLSSDYDAAYKFINESPDTILMEGGEEDGRQTLMAERGPETQFGIMRAIQFAPDGLAYAVTMVTPDDTPVTEAEKQMMRNFTASLEIVQ